MGVIQYDPIATLASTNTTHRRSKLPTLARVGDKRIALLDDLDVLSVEIPKFLRCDKVAKPPVVSLSQAG